MLILTRRIGETILVGDDVRITIAGVAGQQVRLAIDAPRDVPVHREEVYDRIKVTTEVPPTSWNPGIR